MNKYEIILYWSAEDTAYIAEVPELAGCIAHGKTEEIALKNIKAAMELWLKTSLEFNEEIPVPKGRKLIYA